MTENCEKISSDGEIRVIYTKLKNLTENAPSEFREFFKSCLIDDSFKLSELKSEFEFFELFLGITSKKDSAGREKWKTCSVYASNNFRVRSSSHEAFHEHKHKAFDDFRDVFKEFHSTYDDDGSFSIIDALKAAEIFSNETLGQMSELIIDAGLDEKFTTKFAARRFVEILKNYVDIGNEVKVNENQLNNLIHILTSRNFAFDEGKVQLETLKVLKTLKSKGFAEFSQESLKKIQTFINDNRDTFKNVIIECEKLIEEDARDKSLHSMLAHVSQCRVDFLSSIAMFGAETKSEDLIEVMTMKNISSFLAEKEQKLNNLLEEIKKEKILINSNLSPRSALIKISSEYNDLVREVNYLKVKESAKQKLKVEEFLVEFGKIYKGESGVIKFMKDKAHTLTSKVKNMAAHLTENKSEISDGKVENNSKIECEEAVEVTEIVERSKYEKIKIFVDKFRTKDDKKSVVEVPPFISSLLLYAEKQKLTKDEARALLSILTKSTFSSYEDVPKNIIEAFEEEIIEDDDGYSSNLSEESSDDETNKKSSGKEEEKLIIGCQKTHKFDDVQKIINFGLIKDLSRPKNYIDYITKQANEDKNDDDIIKALRKYEKYVEGYSKAVNELIQLFERKNSNKAFEKMNAMIKTYQKIPNKAFEFLIQFLSKNETYKMLDELLVGDLQKIPSSFVVSLVHEINNTKVEVTLDKTQVLDHFIMRGLIKIQQIEIFIEKALEKFSLEALKIIYNAVQLDQKISPEILQKIKNLQATKSNRSLINFLTNSETKLSKLTSGTTSIDDKNEIFNEMENNYEKFQDGETIETLIELVMYDETVTKRAFEVLAKIYHKSYPLIHEEICKTVLFALRCDANLVDVEQFLNHFELNLETMMRKCEDKILREKLKEALELDNFIELSSENLKEILSKNSDKLQEREILMMIYSLEDEKLSSFFEKVAKILQQKELTKTAVESIKYILINNFNHPQFENLLRILPKYDQKVMKKSLNNPQDFIDELIEKIQENQIDEDSLKNLLSENLMSKLSDIQVKSLSDVCTTICESINDIDDKIKEIKDEEKINLIKAREEALVAENERLESSMDFFNYLTSKSESDEILEELMTLFSKLTTEDRPKTENVKQKTEENAENEKIEPNKGSKINFEISAEQQIQKHANFQEKLFFSLFKILKSLSFIKIADENLIREINTKVFNLLKCPETVREKAENSLDLSAALLCTKIYGIKLNDEIFTHFNASSWSRQVLIQIILSSCYDFNEFDLNDFSKVLRTSLSSKVHQILHLIIEKTKGKKFSLQQIIDLFTILKCSGKMYKKFTSASDGFPISPRLHEKWLKEILLDKCAGKDLHDFKVLMKYRPTLIERLLNADDKNKIKTSDFIKIFKTLQQCATVDHDLKFNKLFKLSFTENTTWLPTIELFLIDDLILTKLNSFDKSYLKKLRYGLQRIYHTGWSVNSIIAIVERIKSSSDVIQTSQAIRTLYEYEIDELHSNVKGETALEVVTKYSDFSKIADSLHQIVIHNTFGNAHEKSVDDLCRETSPENPEIEIKLKDQYEKIKNAYLGTSKVIISGSIIKDFDKDEIKKWSERAKLARLIVPDINKLLTLSLNPKPTNNNVPCGAFPKICATDLIFEMIAVLMRAFKIFKGYEPRSIQILSLLMLLNPEDGKGRLAQINTGEGKTTIVAMLAVIKALCGHTVDVITSSPELAKPQAKELTKFYKMFELTVSHNGNDPIEKSIRYKCDIVYGAATDFQGDILRDEYSKLGTRNGRQCDFAIVDEVDSMLIDGRKHIVMLSSSMPAMNYLEHFYAAIWLQIKIFSQAIREENGKFYFVQCELVDCDGNPNEDSEEIWTLIDGTKDDFIKTKLLEFLKKELEKRDESTLKVPNHLRELIVSHQLDQWIGCAIYAKYHSKNNQNYILDNGKVIPVDSDNTGVLQQNMNWSNGLHQFLQIKHGAKITPESLTTNFISNVAFFKRYGKNLFGLTGTLGSKNAQNLLERTYNVDSVIIPPFMVKRYKELSSIIVANEQDWYDEIVDSNMIHLKNQRAVLIITKYISEANELHKRFTEKFNESKMNLKKIRVYKTDHESEAVKDEVESGDLIIATNIAGRGTDIKTSKNVGAHGGLHVCVNSLPSNERVEQQNVGRTSRTGNLGTSQFIIYHKHHSDLSFMKNYRDELENQDLMRAEQEMKKTLVKDEVFVSFCNLLQIVPNNTIKNAIEDRFGIWLQIHGETSEKLAEDYQKFDEEIRSDLVNGKVIKNPVFHILLGNKCVEIENYYEAIDEYTKAIELEGEFSEIAYYNRGYAKLVYYIQCTKSYEKEIKAAVGDLKNARLKIKNREMELQLIQTAKEGDQNVLSEQVSHKIMLYSMQKNVIEQAIGLDADEHKAVMEELNSEKEKMEERLKNLPELEEKFKQLPNFDEELKKLEEDKEVFKDDPEKCLVIQSKIDNFLNSEEFEEFENLKQTKLIPEYLEQLQKQIDSTKNNFDQLQMGSITKALSNEADMKIEIKSIAKSLPDDQNVKLYDEEIKEFSANGMLGAFQITELPDIDWWSVIGVLAIGIAQTVLGGALCVFTLGAASPLGMTFLTEGISDIITAVRDGIVNRSFSWAQYGIQKAISYVTSILCMGMAALKDAAKTVVGGIKSAGSVLTTVTKRGWSLAVKKIGLEVGKRTATEMVKELVNLGVDRALIPQIEKAITEFITPKIISKLKSNENIQNWLKLDAQNRNSYYESLIVQFAAEIIAEEKEKGAFAQIAMGIVDGVATQKINVYEYFKKVHQFVEIASFTDMFLIKFDEKINEEAKKMKESGNNEIKDQNQQEQRTQTQTEDDIIRNLPIQEKGEFEKFVESGQEREDSKVNENEPEEQVKLNSIEPQSSDVYSKIAESVSKKVTSKINGNFIAPYASSLVNKGVNFAAAGLEEKMNHQMKLYKSERRTEFFQNKDKDNRIPDEFKKAHENEETMKEVNEDIDKFAEGEKVGVQHLGSVSDALGVQITVLDENGKVIRTIGEGKPVEVRYKDGHYTLSDGSNPPGGSSNPNDCLFNVIASQIGESENAAEMRAKTVEALKANSTTLAHQHDDVNFLKIHKRDVLHEGGIVNPTRKEVKNFIEGKEDKVQGARSYKEFKDDLEGRQGCIDVHHEPPDSSYDKDTHKDNKLCIAMDHQDHQNLLSTKDAAYVDSIKSIINSDPENGFANALLIGCLDIHATSLKTGNGSYTDDMISLVNGHEKSGKINEQQARDLREKIGEFPMKSENFTPEYLENHKDAFGGNVGKVALGKFTAKLNGENPKKVKYDKPKRKTNIEKYHENKRIKKSVEKREE